MRLDRVTVTGADDLACRSSIPVAAPASCRDSGRSRSSASQLPRIEGAVDDRGYETRAWIDMETRVRSEDDVTFDLDKVRRCLEISAPWVTA